MNIVEFSSEDKLGVTLSLPVLAFGDFDSTGQLAPWRLARMLEAGRIIPSRQYDYLGLKDVLTSMSSTLFLVQGAYKLESTAEFAGQLFINHPFKVTTQLIATGKKFLLLKSELRRTSNNQLYASLLFNYVHVDWKSRRATDFPAWFMDKYTTKCQDKLADFPRLAPLVPSVHCFVRPCEIAWSDIDRQQHTNNAEYIRKACDCAVEAARVGFLSNIVNWAQPREMLVRYIKETRLGDKLQVKLWQTDGYPLELKFLFERNNASVFEATFKYRTGDQAKL